jgi:hypothetical protein
MICLRRWEIQRLRRFKTSLASEESRRLLAFQINTLRVGTAIWWCWTPSGHRTFESSAQFDIMQSGLNY